jgi:hypothetical protein
MATKSIFISQNEIAVVVGDLIASFDNLVDNHCHLHYLSGSRIVTVSPYRFALVCGRVADVTCLF